MKTYRCLLFDLDHTLWDYETNARETLSELFDLHRLDSKGLIKKRFQETFYKINEALWDQYDRGLIHQEVIRNERFYRIFLELGLDDRALSLQFSDQYVHESPKKSNLMEGCVETLEYLYAKYPMVIVTNGFEEIQSTKLHSSGIHHFFKSVVTSARAGHKKPSKEIFEFALKENNFHPDEAIMIGDNLLTDIAGAKHASVDTVFFNPNTLIHQTQVNFEIKKLSELKNFL